MSLWRDIQKESFTSVKELAAFLELSPCDQEKLLSFSVFPLKLPKRLAKKIIKGILDDPILLQFVPHILEENSPPQFSPDPLNEKDFKKSSKLLIKYSSRALLLTTSACAMHCRFCFRRHFPYEKNFFGFEKELKLIEQDSSLEEIILSGGDPLSLSDVILGSLLSQLESIAHVKRVRFHTRFPVGIPERITSEFLNLLEKRRFQIVFVIHVNHPRELDSDVLSALKQIHKLGIPILNQTVLLKGVNDSLDTLKELFQTLVNHGFFPYYLHALDEVKGASHFAVSDERAQTLIKELTAQLSGYAIPKFVREIAGHSSKTVVL